jgi:hypothetical protein
MPGSKQVDAHALWVRGLTRLRTQLRVVSAFRSVSDRDSLRRRASIMARFSLAAPTVCWIVIMFD